MSAIETAGLGRSFDGVQALRGVDLTVERGTFTGLIGPNGAGKTTLLRILAGLERADTGRAEVAGTRCGAEDGPVPERPSVGFVPDHQGVYERLSVREYLLFFAAAHGLPESRRRPRVEEVLELTGLLPLSGKQASTLSRGVTQRLSLGRALLPNPDVLLLDEPASGLDPRARVAFFDLLLRLRDEGKTLLVSSHILKELSDLVDAVAILEAGRLVAQGKVAEVLAAADGPGLLRLRIELLHSAPRAGRRLEAAEPVRGVEVVGERTLRVFLEGGPELVPPLLADLLGHDLPVTGVAREGVDLERAFLSLTRDEVV